MAFARMFCLWTVALAVFLTSACRDRSQSSTPAKSYSESERKKATQEANAFFDRAFDELVAADPEWQTQLGIKKDYGKWTDISEAGEKQRADLTRRLFEESKKAVLFEALDDRGNMSYRLFERWCADRLEDYEYRHNTYPINQMYGVQSTMPALLINQHKLDSSSTDKAKSDADAYLERIGNMPVKIDQLLEQLQIREGKGVMPPKLILEKVLADCKNLIAGYPFDKDKNKPNDIYADFSKKIKANPRLSAEMKNLLLLDCEKQLVTRMKPAYEKLIAAVEEQIKHASADAGVWKFPNGEAYYKVQLRRHTTTNLSAEEIHQVGLKEVQRIQKEMEALKDKVGFKGTLQEFFAQMRTDARFFYPNTAEGKAAYLRDATAIIDTMRTRLAELFTVLPKAKMIVKAVEPFREASAGKAFYEDPAPDGSRPGIYYVNLYNMADMPNYQMEALAYHEGIPGHHLQIAIAQELQDMPKFRRLASPYTAYVEGWALYTELIPKEIGFYQNPYSDFGRLAMELWRACRLVVDTGIHSKKWTREEGIKYYTDNTPNPEGDCIKMVNRHLVMPGQATSYKIGMIKIVELRNKARQALADKFDIRRFHDLLLANGSLPLDMLEETVDQFIAQNK